MLKTHIEFQFIIIEYNIVSIEIYKDNQTPFFAFYQIHVIYRTWDINQKCHPNLTIFNTLE